LKKEGTHYLTGGVRNSRLSLSTPEFDSLVAIRQWVDGSGVQG
jgi:hypothetical protein